MFRKINLVEDLLAAGRKGRGRSDIRQEDAQFLFDLLLLEPKERIVARNHPARERLRKRIGGMFKDPKFVDVGYVVDPVDGHYWWKLLDIEQDGDGRSCRIVAHEMGEKERIMEILWRKYLRPGKYYFTKLLQVVQLIIVHFDKGW